MKEGEVGSAKGLLVGNQGYPVWTKRFQSGECIPQLGYSMVASDPC